MGTSAQGTAASVSLADLESLIRRVVREELTRQRQQDILEDRAHEGPPDPEGDESLLREALMVSQEYRADKEGWLRWEEFEAEIDRAEAAGERPEEDRQP
jgi:hypothetical protein